MCFQKHNNADDAGMLIYGFFVKDYLDAVEKK